MEPAYRSALTQPDTDVYVISVPYLSGDRLTLQEGGMHDDGGLLPEDIVLTTPEEYDIAVSTHLA